VGSVRSVNPARREVRVAPLAGYGPCFAGMGWVHVVLEGVRLRCKVDSATPHHDLWILRLGAGVLRETVSKMRGSAVVAPKSSLAPAPGGEWPPGVFEGLEMLGPGGPEGAVTAAFRNGAQTVLELRRPAGGTARVVLVPGLVTGVDLENGVMTVGDISPYVVDDAN
jgi:ribosomal 30S subunit maturation factor RimM